MHSDTNTTSLRFPSWTPEAVVLGSCLTVVGLALGALTAAPAAAVVAVFAALAIAAERLGDSERV